MPYRLEYAKTDRAVCKKAACGHAMAQIPKGGLKIGTWVDVNDGFFTWQHWGCISANVVANIQKEIEGDSSMLDGFEDLTEEDQNRVSTALVAGEIPPEDITIWTAAENATYQQYLADEEEIKTMRKDSKDNNTPFNLKDIREAQKNAREATRKAAKEKSKNDEKEAKKKAKEDEKEAKAQAKADAAAAKAQVKAGAAAAKANKNVKTTRKRKQDEDTDSESGEEPASKKQARGRRTVKKEQSVDEDGEASEREVTKKPARGRKAVVTKKEVKKEESDTEVGDTEEPVPIPTKANTKVTRTKKAVKKVYDEEDGDAEAEPEPPKRATRGRRAKN